MSRETHSDTMADTQAAGAPSKEGARFRDGQRITQVSVAVNVVLTTMQLLVGFAAHSQSLIADAMHTLSDIVADGFVLFANRKGAEAADADHPYGHGRFETAASLVLGLLLAGTGAGILVTAAGRLQDIGSAPPVGIAAMWAALFTLAAKEGLFRYMLATAERLRSPMLVANAWHARADALSSLVVAAGVGGALLGFNIADAVAAIVVGAMIVRAGLKFAWQAIRELIDTGLSAEEVAAIRHTIASTPGRARHARVAYPAHGAPGAGRCPCPGQPAHQCLGRPPRRRIGAAAGARQSHPEVLDVLVHVDAEDDLLGRPPVALPDRPCCSPACAKLLGAEPPDFERTTLHYLAAGGGGNIPAAGLCRSGRARLHCGGRVARPENDPKTS
jgi:cation diffusion facilitator family transporter